MSTITVTATVEPLATPPRVRLDVADTGTPALLSTTITRQNPDGTSATVRTSDGQPLALTSGAALLYDYEEPYQASITYSSVESPSLVTSPVSVPENRIWLIDPGVPSLSMPVLLGDGALTSMARPTTRGVFRPLGRANAVVQTDGKRKGVASSLNVVTQTTAELAALVALLDDCGPLLLNIPTSKDYGFPSCYISVDTTTEARPSPKLPDTWRVWALPFDVVDRPLGGTQAERTYSDPLDFPTYGALLAAYATYGDLLAGP